MPSRFPRGRLLACLTHAGATLMALMAVAAGFACSSSGADDVNHDYTDYTDVEPEAPPPDPAVVAYDEALTAINAVGDAEWWQARDAVNAAMSQLASAQEHEWRRLTLIARTYELKRMRAPALHFANLAVAAAPTDAIARGVRDRMLAPVPSWGETAAVMTVERVGAETEFALYRLTLVGGDGHVDVHDVVVPSWLEDQRAAEAAGPWNRATIDRHPMSMDAVLRIARDGDEVAVTRLTWDRTSDEWIEYGRHRASEAADIVAYARRIAEAYVAINFLDIQWPVVPARWYLNDRRGVDRAETLIEDVLKIEALAATFNERDWVRKRLAEICAYIAMDPHVAGDIRAIAIRAGVCALRDHALGGIGDAFKAPRATAILALLTRAFPLSASANGQLDEQDQGRLQVGELMGDWHQDSYVRKDYWDDAELHLFTNTRGAPSPAALHHLWLAQTDYGERVYTLAVQTAHDTPIYHTLRYDFGTETLVALSVGQPPRQEDWRAIVNADLEAFPIGGTE